MALEERRADPDPGLVVVACALALASLGADVVARLASIGSPWVLVSFHLLVGALAALLGGVARTRGGAPWRRGRWLGAIAGLGAVAVLHQRASLTDPLPKLVLPLAVGATALLLAEAWARRIPLAAALEVHLRRLAHVGAIGGAWALLGPTDLGSIHVADLEGAISGALLVMSALALLALRGRRAPGPAVASSGLHLAGGLGLLASAVGPGASGVAAVIAVALGLLGSGLSGRPGERAALAGAVWARRAGAAAVRASRRAPREGAHWVRRAWWGLGATAAPARLTVPPRRSGADRAVAGAMGLGSLAFVGGAIAWAAHVGWQPTGHSATVMARSYDVGTVNHPLVGMITSLGDLGGANHPGPMLFDLLAPLVRLLGARRAAYAGGALIALVAWWVATWAAWRAAGRTAAVLAWVTAALVIEIPTIGAVWDANNVSTTMLAMFTTVLSAWAAMTGTWRAWWWAVALGSLCAQAYLPHGLIVVGPVLWSGLALSGARRRSTDADEVRRITRALRGGWAIAAVCWVQPLIDVLINDGGNVRGLTEQIQHPRPAVGWVGIPRTIAWMATLPPRWSEITTTFAEAGTAMRFLGGSMVVGLLVAALLGGLAWRTRHSVDVPRRQLRWLVALVAVGAAINITQLPQERLRSFSLGWLVVASMIMWFAVAHEVAVVARAGLRRAQPAVVRPLQAAAAVGAAAVVLVAAISGPDTIADMKGRTFTVDAMVDPLVAATVPAAPRHGEVLVLGMDTLLNQVSTDTLVSNLIVEGVDVRLEPGPGLHYGRRRLVEGRWDGPMLWVVSGLDAVKPEGRRVARASMPDWSAARYRRVEARVAAWVRAHGDLRLQPWAQQNLARYLAGWSTGDVCSTVRRAASGEVRVADLPPGALVSLAADLALAPPFPAGLAEDAAEVVGPAPIEVWRVDGALRGPISTDHLLRDGTPCSIEPSSAPAP